MKAGNTKTWSFNKIITNFDTFMSDMQDIIRNTICDNLVNYSNVATSAANSLDYTPTESHESLSFLMKNNVILNFSLIPNQQVEETDKQVTKEEQLSSFYR